MVSKVAVVALVAILAVPILMGYAMNLEETTHNDYKITKDPVNVTGLLENGEYYNSAYADIYKLNTSFASDPGCDYHILPFYENTSGTMSSLPFEIADYSNWPGGTQSFSGLEKYYIHFGYRYGNGTVTATIYSNGTLLQTVNHCMYCYYDRDTDSVTYIYYNNDGYPTDAQISGGSYDAVNFTLGGITGVDIKYGVQYSGTNTSFVDFSAGFTVDQAPEFYIDLPNDTRSYIMTINLDSIQSSGNRFILKSGGIYTFTIYKTTTNGVVEYYVQDGDGNNTYLYYDPNKTDNTYQLYFQLTNLGLYDDGFYHYNFHNELKYVGSWPTLIGAAPYYVEYKFDQEKKASGDFYGFKAVQVLDFSQYGFSPIMRMDSALYTGMLFTTIYDNTYNPASFRSNPSTTISNISLFGSSLTFGGTNFIVKDGNITLGTHDVSVRNMVFDSIPVAGGYENRINGVVISTTATPSTLTFGGHWKAQIVTDSMELTTYTSTDWTPGQFAWDGIDQNFLMIGLLAALGVFVALGIAYRKTKAALGALLVVCGGAAILFFTML